MAIDNRIGTKVIKNLRMGDAPGINVSPYPYIGVVKNNLDPTRCGRVQVFIPEFGGNPDEPSNWRTVSYASPFMGYTSTELQQTDNPSTAESFDGVSHTYGMWMVPPDIGIEVIVIFVAGDPARGYWLACVNSKLSRHMLPAMAGSPNVNIDNASKEAKLSYQTGTRVPVVEFNESKIDNSTNPNFYNIPKPIHEVQYSRLKQQGLDTDTIRGTISSSSQRETPSHVFGISTPGRPTNDPADDPLYVSKLNAGTLNEDYYRVKSRKGGHTFVMDDGSVLGVDQLIRLRTAAGHQILMHDTEQTIYISNAHGNSWVELSKDGSINVYSKSGFNLRSEGDINIHSDKNINLNAGGNIGIHSDINTNIHSNKNVDMYAQGNAKVQALSDISLNAANDVAIYQNGNTVMMIYDPLNTAPVISTTTTLSSFNDTSYNTQTGSWSASVSTISSIVGVLPTHEPYFRG
jgi:hypothetical protein